jgi:TonB family protein
MRPNDSATPFVQILYAHIIETNNPGLANGKPAPRVPAPVVLEDLTKHLTLLPGLPSIELAVTNESAVQVAPRLLDGAQPPVTDFARRGGLRPGESAFVVLRLQIVPGGQVADVAVDVSSGSRQVDEAARAYGMATRWLAGRDGSLEVPKWVRLGLQLRA